MLPKFHVHVDPEEASLLRGRRNFSSTSSDGAEDARNTGVTACMVERVGVVVASSFKYRSLLAMVVVTKMVVGVPVHSLAR